MEAIMKDEMYAEIVTVTPEIAEEWLKKNGANRNVKTRRVDMFAEQMAKGEWQLNGESIVLSEDGKLLDGQHRLLAVKRSRMSVKMLVVFNAPNTSSVFDLGAIRSESDALLMEGMDKGLSKHANVAMAKLHFHVQGISKGKKTVPLYMIRDFLNQYKDTVLAVSHGVFGNNRRTATGVNVCAAPLRLACLYAIETGTSIDTIYDFAEIVRTGICFDPKKSSAIVLRNDMIVGNASPAIFSDRIKMVHQTEKAIYDFVSGVKRTLTYKSWDSPIFSTAEKFRSIE